MNVCVISVAFFSAVNEFWVQWNHIYEFVLYYFRLPVILDGFFY
jgi:hypothetical protein